MAATNLIGTAVVEVEHKLPLPFDESQESFELIAQGAESLLYRTTFSATGQPAALKVRPEKKWRHPTLDKRLTRARILAEARVLVKLSGEGIVASGSGNSGKRAKVKQPREGDHDVAGLKGFVPAVLALDWESGWMMTEWIEGRTVKKAVYDTKTDRNGDNTTEATEALKSLLACIGEVIGILHASGVIHGDLTTSNMMLRAQPSTPESIASPTSSLAGDIVLIDFGLSSQSVSEEDRAVDLYVLERAFGSTHPREEYLFPEVLKTYAESTRSGMHGKTGKLVLRKLEDVRMRGRKKSMLG
ncbi:hypothetical protein LTR62_001485 [Meristemomyces frigidus]|uniref:EKC/KEOPS complex subunit BUD32 n=1 Tax=Meristemomyces frigidus TaxID=1508187 RepID=A0AAN7TN28_9PEZI|nr:hypothetical protein LTR62_001485 [Meristemomyces frigidus]